MRESLLPLATCAVGVMAGWCFREAQPPDVSPAETVKLRGEVLYWQCQADAYRRAATALPDPADGVPRIAPTNLPTR